MSSRPARRGSDDVQFGQVGFRIDSDAAKPVVLDASGRRLLRHRGTVRPGRHEGVRRQRAGPVDEALVADIAVADAQVYYDRTNRRVQRQYRATGDTVDVDAAAAAAVRLASHASSSAAASGSSHGDDLGDGPGFFFDPQCARPRSASFFAQDDIALKPERLSLDRRLQNRTERLHRLRAAAERPAAAHARSTADVLGGGVAGGPHADPLRRRPADSRAGHRRLLLTGSDAFESENVLAYEAGYRVRADGLGLVRRRHLRQQLRRHAEARNCRRRPAYPVVLGNRSERQNVRRGNRRDRAPDAVMAGARLVQLPVGTVFARSRQPRYHQRRERSQRSIASVLGAHIRGSAAQDRARRAVPLCVRAAAARPLQRTRS